MVRKRKTKEVKRGKKIKDLSSKRGAKTVRGGDGYLGVVSGWFGSDPGLGDRALNRKVSKP